MNDPGLYFFYWCAIFGSIFILVNLIYTHFITHKSNNAYEMQVFLLIVALAFIITYRHFHIL